MVQEFRSTKSLQETEGQCRRKASQTCSCPELVWLVVLMAKPLELESVKFKDMQELILAKLRPKKKLIIAERSKFMTLR